MSIDAYTAAVVGGEDWLFILFASGLFLEQLVKAIYQPSGLMKEGERLEFCRVWRKFGSHQKEKGLDIETPRKNRHIISNKIPSRKRTAPANPNVKALECCLGHFDKTEGMVRVKWGSGSFVGEGFGITIIL